VILNAAEWRERVVLITGATGGLGAAVTREFAGTSARLALVSRSAQALQALVDEHGLPSERAFTMAADVTKPEQVNAIVEAIMARWKRVDVLLNTVGGWRGGQPVEEITLQSWQHMLDLNLNSAFLLSRAVLPPMLETGWGRIVHVSSKTAVSPRAKQAGYAVAKMGLISLTEVIAAEVKRSGVTANVILPSIIDTPANRNNIPQADPSKWVAPEHIAATMRFLCSDTGALLNGARIPIYGGV
jgi:NAD(P)-dependent dehydrogenase (short-subunit alcohol dehydrogenase family)